MNKSLDALNILSELKLKDIDYNGNNRDELDLKDIVSLIDLFQDSSFKELSLEFKSLKFNIMKSNEDASYNKNPQKNFLSNPYSTNKKKHELVIKSDYVAIIKLKDNLGNPYIKTGLKVKKGFLLFKLEYLNITIDYFSKHDCIIKDIFVKDSELVDYGKEILSATILNK